MDSQQARESEARSIRGRHAVVWDIARCDADDHMDILVRHVPGLGLAKLIVERMAAVDTTVRGVWTSSSPHKHVFSLPDVTYVCQRVDRPA